MHRRAGKTVACVNELLGRALYTEKVTPKYAYLGPFRGQVKQVAWQYLKDYGERYIAKVNETELCVELLNGARIFLAGADNPDSLRGLFLDGVILDEYADMKPTIWGAVLRPMLADREGWAVFIGTPKGHNGFYDIAQLAQKEPDWFFMTLRASESGLLKAKELESAKRSMTPDQYEQEFECSFEAAITGGVYSKWMAQAEADGRIGKVPVLPGVPVCTAWDLGFDDATAIWWFQVLRGEIRVIDYYENNGEAIPHYCEVIHSRGYEYGKHYVPHDAANELLAAGGRSIVQQAHGLGVKMYVVPATSQQNGIEATRMTLGSCWFDRDKCGPGIEALKLYEFQWDEERKIFREKPKHNWASHGADAFEIIAQVWRNPKDDKPPDRPRFLHEARADEIFWPADAGRKHKRL